MEQFSEEDLREAKDFLEFYVELLENSKNVAAYYMSEDVILDWFGRTVKGEKNISIFLKSNLSSVKHYFGDAKPGNSVGFRETHIVKSLRAPKKPPISLLSPPRLCEVKTPRKRREPQTEASTSSSVNERGQGDGFHNYETPQSPLKKLRSSVDDFESDNELVEAECDNAETKIKYVTAEGHVEFHRPSIKKLQTETKWKRPCKLSIAYSSGKKINQDCTIYTIIYEGNVKCRRNLLKEFESTEPEDL